MSMRTPRPDGLYPVRLDQLELTDEELAAEAVASARDGVAGLRAANIEPTPALLARAAGDPELVAVYVARHRYRNTTTCVT
jgi:hypothetical protein